MPSILPSDIVETIVDILAQEDADLSATKTCSLVSPNFLHICRKRIFAAVALNERYIEPSPPYVHMYKTTTSAFHQLLSATPGIADYIRDLNYMIIPADLENENVQSLVQSLKRITRLQSLTLWSNHGLLWNDNPLRPALLHLIHLSTFVDLSLYSTKGFMVADLLPSLQTFTCGGVDVLPTSLFNVPTSPIRLHTLSVGCRSNSIITQFCTAGCADGKSIIDFGGLAHLTSELLDEDDLETLQELLSQCTKLVYVRIEVPEMSIPLIGLHSMLAPSMQTLKHLDVQAIFEDGDTDPYCGIADELEHMGHRNVIESLEILITISVDAECTRGDEWGRLDKVLTQYAWLHLQRVSLRIVIINHAREDELQEELQELPTTQFPSIVSRKSLLFTFEVEELWV